MKVLIRSTVMSVLLAVVAPNALTIPELPSQAKIGIYNISYGGQLYLTVLPNGTMRTTIKVVNMAPNTTYHVTFSFRSKEINGVIQQFALLTTNSQGSGVVSRTRSIPIEMDEVRFWLEGIGTAWLPLY